MNRTLIYFPLLIVLVFTLSLTTIESFNSINAQVDPAEEQVEPLPPSNNTNSDNISSMIFSQ